MNATYVSLAAVLLLTHLATDLFAAAGPTTKTATTPATRSAVIPANIADAPVVRLWPNDPPATGAFDATDNLIPRGTPAAPQLNINGIRYPSLLNYVKPAARPRAAVIICPGGGYASQSLSKEGVAVAEKFAENGVAAFVLRYRLSGGKPPADGELPVPQQDVLRAIQLVRHRAAEWNIDPDRIGVAGFSAGGHLAATAATMYDQAPSLSTKAGDDAIAKTSARPDFAVLLYPVINMNGKSSHTGSRDNLLGKTTDAAARDRWSVERHVTAKTPPLFVVHAVDDKTVPLVNATLLIEAAAAAGVPHALHVLSHGGHGFGLGNNPETLGWHAQCIAWMRGQNLIDAR